MTTEEEISHVLSSMLNELLEYGNQEGSFVVKNIDLEKMKFLVEFDIVIVKEDDYIGFQGY